MLACKCGSLEVRITSATETTDENGRAVSWKEQYECKCGKTGKLKHRKDGSERLTGCLTHSGGGI